jgi:hypothetical protein
MSSPREVLEGMRQPLVTEPFAEPLGTETQRSTYREPLVVKVRRFGRRMDIRDLLATVAECLVGIFTAAGYVVMIAERTLFEGQPLWVPYGSLTITLLFVLVCYGSVFLYRQDFRRALRSYDLPIRLASGEVEPPVRGLNLDLEAPQANGLEALVWRISKSPRKFLGSFTRHFSRSWLIVYYGAALFWIFLLFTLPYWFPTIPEWSYVPYTPILEFVLPPIVLAHLRTIRHREVVRELASMLSR